jgi:hypothetical protein
MSEENRWLTLALVVMSAVLIFLYSVDITKGQEQPGHTHHGAAGKFYQSWMQPDNRAISCCHDQDCAPAQSRLVNGKWQARNSDDEDWIDIPARKVETERDSPDGRSHLCKRSSQWGAFVYCFLPASGS